MRAKASPLPVPETHYDFRAKSAIGRETARMIGETLIALGGDKRPVQARELLNAARPKSSPLHRLFEWDNAVAGEKYRLEQARFYLRTIEIVPVTDGKEQPPMRAAPLVVLDGERGFMFAPDAFANAEGADYIVKQAKAALAAWSRIYGGYKKLATAASFVAKALEEAEKIEWEIKR